MIDFNKSAEEISALVRAMHPWGKTYFSAEGENYLSPNPHKIYILDNNTNITEVGKFIEISPETKSVTVVCSENKLIKFEDVSLYEKEWKTSWFLRKLKKHSLIL